MHNHTKTTLKTVDELLAAQDEAVQAEQWDLAIEFGERILALTPRNDDVAYTTGVAYNQRAVHAMDDGDHNQALLDLNHAIQYLPNDALAFFNRGLTRYRLSNYAGALDDARRAIEVREDDFDLLVFRARCHRALANPDEALADYMRALDTSPSEHDIESLVEIGDALASAQQHMVAMTRWDLAITLGERLLTLKPKDPNAVARTAQAYRGRAWRTEKSGDQPGALGDRTRSLELEPQWPAQWHNRGLIYRALGQAEAAIADFTRAIELDPSGADFFTQRGHCYYERLDYRMARSDYSRAIELLPEELRAMPWHNIGLAHRALGNLERAVEAFSHAMGTDPSNTDFFLERAGTYIAAGNYAEAVADCLQAIQRLPQRAEPYRVLGVAYREAGDFVSAAAECNHAIELDPEAPVSYWSRGLVLEALGESEAAQRDRDLGCRLEKQELKNAGRNVTLDDAKPDLAALLVPSQGSAGSLGFQGRALRSGSPAEHLTLAQRWVVALHGALTHMNGGSFAYLGMWPVHHRGRENAAGRLAGWWTIRSRAHAIRRLRWLARAGNGADYALFAQSDKDLETRFPEDEAVRFKCGFVREHRAEIGERTLLAWDYGRLVAVAGWSWLAGYLDDVEVWEWSFRAAHAIQAAYGSWQEFGRHYLLGRLFGMGDEGRARHACNWLLSSEDSPWRRLAWLTCLDTPDGSVEANPGAPTKRSLN